MGLTVYVANNLYNLRIYEKSIRIREEHWPTRVRMLRICIKITK